MDIPEAVKKLLEIVEELKANYPNKKFTLDGRLVGDLGEVIVEQYYEVDLFPGLMKGYDGKTPGGRKVQIKTTMQDHLTFPCNHIPDYYIGIKIFPEGDHKEIFNGPGKVAHQAIANRNETNNNLHSISISKLIKLNQEVSPNERIPKRKDKGGKLIIQK